MPWCRRLVPAFLPRRPGFEPSAVIVGFSEEQMVTAIYFSPSALTSPCRYHYKNVPLLNKYICNLRCTVVATNRLSKTLRRINNVE